MAPKRTGAVYLVGGPKMRRLPPSGEELVGDKLDAKNMIINDSQEEYLDSRDTTGGVDPVDYVVVERTTERAVVTTASMGQVTVKRIGMR